MSDSTQPTEALQSQLSAFIDNELPAAESELFTRRLLRDADLKQAMNSYLLMGEAMRSRTPPVSRDFSARIAAAIQEGETGDKTALPMAPRSARRAGTRWLKPVAAMGVAASVAMLAVTLVRTPQNVPVAANDEALVPVAMTAQRVNEADSYVVPTAAEGPTVPLPAARLTNYVVAHSEYASPLGRRTTLTGLLAADDEAAQPVAETTGSASSSSLAEAAQ